MLRLLAAAALPCYALADGGTNYLVAAGRDFSFVVNNGVVTGTGRNHHGQLGVGSKDDVDELTAVELPFNFDDPNNTIMVTQVAAGAFHTLFLLNNGEVYVTGRGREGQLGLGSSDLGDRTTPERLIVDDYFWLTSKVKAVAAGYAHSVFLLENGVGSKRHDIIFVTGSNRVGQLGRSRDVKNLYTPKWTLQGKAKGIAAGYDFTYILTDDGMVKVTGQNLGGQLGFQLSDERYKKTQFRFHTLWNTFDGPIREVQAGESHGFFIGEDDQVYGTGSNFDGQLGDGSTIAKKVPKKLLYDAKVLSTGGDSTCIGRYKLECFGSNRDGQLGLNQQTNALNPTPVINEENEEIDFADSIAVGGTHSLFLNHEKVYVTGKNTRGQLGNSSLDAITRLFFLTALSRLERTTTVAPPTPAPTPAPSTPPTPTPGTTEIPTRKPGSDEDDAREWPLVPLGLGVATGLAIVCVVVFMFGGSDPSETDHASVELGDVATVNA